MTPPTLSPPADWIAPSSDPNDVQFGDVVEPVRTADRETLAAYAVVFVGEPFDEGVIGRRGAKEGPAAIRRALASVTTHHFERGTLESSTTGGASSQIGDLGTVALDLEGDEWDWGESTVAEIQRTVRRVSEFCHDAPPLPIFLGGDNSLSYANAAPLLESGSASLGVITLDAHLDVREVGERGPTSGTPYRQLFDAGLDAYACVGARPVETSRPYHEFVHERDGTIVTATDVGDDPHAAARAALEGMGDVERVYVSLDVDVLDATAAPGVSAPTPGGLTTRELYRILRTLAGDDRIAGFEVVECAPPLDRDGLTSDAAARAIAHFLAGYLEVSPESAGNETEDRS